MEVHCRKIISPVEEEKEEWGDDEKCDAVVNETLDEDTKATLKSRYGIHLY